MPTYYVKPTGDNTKDGLSSANAWETITYALTQMIGNDELIIAAGAYAEGVTIATEHITLTGAGSGSVTIISLEMVAPYPNVSGISCAEINGDHDATNIALDDVIANALTILICADSATLNNCEFNGILLPVQANAPAFTNCTFHAAVGNTLRLTGGSVLNATFENTTILGDPGAYKAIRILNGTNTTFTNTTFECPEKAIEVANSATATFIQNNRKVFVGTVGMNTVTSTESTLAVADGTYDYRDFIVTPDASVVISETSLWETSGDQNKAWKVEATGSRTIAFQLGDMQPNTKYNLLVDSIKTTDATADNDGVISFDYSGTFSEKTFATSLTIPMGEFLNIDSHIHTSLQAESEITTTLNIQSTTNTAMELNSLIEIEET